MSTRDASPPPEPGSGRFAGTDAVPDAGALQRLLAMAAENDEAALAPPALPRRYEIVRELGRGGMGVVHEVIDHQLGRRCALKTLAGTADVELRRRFAREAAAAARLRHPHIAAVHDATPEFLTMQLVDGGPIGGPRGDALVGDRRLAAQLVRDAALALQHAHDQGVVHRDVKPSNLLVEGRHVFVVDFGLAKHVDAASSLSLAGAVVGTPAFMAPEQALGQVDRVDARSDVYGLGATLWYCLTGAPPFAAPDLPALLRAVVEDEPRSLGDDRDLDLVLAKCLAKEPQHRYAQARELADDLERWLRDEPVQARRPSWWWRMQKRVRRQRAIWRAAAAAIVLTALVLVPVWLHESTARAAADEAVLLADHVATVLQDSTLSTGLGNPDEAHTRLAGGIGHVRAFLARHDVPRVRFLLARLLVANHEDDAALAELDAALAREPELADARFERGLLLAARLDPSPELRARALADLGVPLPEHSVVRDVDRLFGRAEAARLRGEANAALELLREVLEYDGMHLRARLALVAAARELGDGALATYYSASIVDLRSGYGPAYLARERATLPTTIAGVPGALVDFSGELRAAPSNALGVAQRALVQLRRAVRLDRDGDSVAAIAAAQAAVAGHDHVALLVEDVPGVLVNRAVCRLVLDRLCTKSGDAAGAAAAREAAAQDLAAALRPRADGRGELPEAHADVGLLALRTAEGSRALGRAEAASRAARDAVSAFDRALARAPEDWPHAAACRRHREQAAAWR